MFRSKFDDEPQISYVQVVSTGTGGTGSEAIITVRRKQRKIFPSPFTIDLARPLTVILLQLFRRRGRGIRRAERGMTPK